MASAKPSLFLSGPISNGDSANEATRTENIENATAVADALEDMGFKVYCPHRELREFATAGKTYRWLMKECLRALTRVDAIVFLPGWEGSKGAREENWYAGLLNGSRNQKLQRFYSLEDLLAAHPSGVAL